MSTLPTIDIIIPNFNKAKYLEQCLKSIIDQTYKNWKVYLVDDKSTDGSIEILNKFKNIDNINIFLLEQNKGPSHCRNLGIKNSNSDFITFLDSDDYWPQDKLEKQLSVMLKNSYYFTYTDFQFFFNDKVSELKKTNLPNFFDYKSFTLHSTMSTSSIMLKRSFLKKNLFQNVNHEDYLFKCDLLRNGDLAFKIKETYVYYRINNTNRSSSKIKNIINLWNINKKKNNLSFFSNLKSLVFISFNSLIKYGWK